MRGFIAVCAIAAVICVGCAPTSGDAVNEDRATSHSRRAVDPASAEPEVVAANAVVEPGSVFGAAERDTHDALAPFEEVTLVTPDGGEIAFEVPSKAACADEECAIYAAMHFLAMQDDVIAGRAVDEWLALSSPDCYFCMDTVTVRDELVAADITVDGGYVTLNNVPVVFTEDYILEMPPFNDFDFADPTLVPLSLSTDQAEITFDDHGETLTRESAWITFLMVMRWDGAYWRVESVLLT